jgi:predicted AlkP superfamily phosphohydrolase/phosphomutase
MKVLVLGLDCATPQLVFDRWRADLPTLSGLMAAGDWGRLESSNPPITVPAWSCMMSSKDPGQLGFYGFRNRKDHSYDGLFFANSNAMKEDRVWDILSRAGKRVILVGIPQTYPPRPVNGEMVTCFLTPDTRSQYTFPPALKAEVERVAEGYILDVDDFRTDDKQRILDTIHQMTVKRFRVMRHLLSSREWDFAMMVEMGIDRIHHGFWKYMDPSHPKHEPGNPWEGAIRDYYKVVDGEIARLLQGVPADTVVYVVSDHGARSMIGGICVNEWLMQNGYLTLKETPAAPTPIGKVEIDWSKTMAWGEGGYYSRIFMNVQGREPQGVIPAAEYEKVRGNLIAGLQGICDERGHNIGTVVHRPEEIYRRCNGVPPDLLTYFGNLDWRSVGSVGMGSIWTYENDTGPDDANHDWHGIFIRRQPGHPGRGELQGLQLFDMAPTILKNFGLPIPGDMIGKAIA